MTADDAARPRLPRTLAARLTDRLAVLLRGPGWRRVALLRRLAAGLLVVAASVLAVWPVTTGDADTAPVLVTTRDLAPGATIGPADVVVRRWPTALMPSAALSDHAQIEGRPLAGAARAGEPITDLRLAGPELAQLATGSTDTASIAIRLADADVAALLHPGRAVDVVSAGAQNQNPVVLASGAVVLAVLPADDAPGRRGRLVLVSLPRPIASRVAGAALTQQVTVTIR